MRYTNADITNVSPKIRELLKSNSSVEEVKDELSRTPEKRLMFNKGLFLYGITGSGKTYALYAIKNNLASKMMKTTRVENWVNLLIETRDRIAQNQGLKSVIDNITEKDFIFLDDIGAEKNSEWVQELFYSLLDTSYLYNKTLFISTNLSLDEFANRYGERMLSRIAQMCEIYKMEDEDKRLTN